MLVVEDEPSLADILRITLEFHGFRVLRAATGARAVEMARKHRPDLLLLDVMLPDGNGWQVCRTVRSEREDVPVVFLTARDAPADIVGGLALGGDDYITKPFNIDEVVARVRAVLRRVRLQSPPPRCCGTATWRWTRRRTPCGARALRWTSRRPSTRCCAT